MSRKRNPNFSETELQVLLVEVEKNKSVIFSKLSNLESNNSKKRVWDVICEKINACNASGHIRAAEDIRKKNHQVSEILGDTPIDGIEGGVDTAESSTSTSRDR